MDPPPYKTDSDFTNQDNGTHTAYPPQQPHPTGTQPPYYPAQPQTAGQPYYPQPQAYAPQPYLQQPQYYPPQQQQQQQSSVTVVNAGQTQAVGYVQQVPYQSFCGHIVLACFVAWCCGLVFGIIAFILAMVASDRSGTGRAVEARQLGRASIAVSIAGIVVTCIIIAIIVGVNCGTGRCSSSYYYNNYNYNNRCYSYYYGYYNC